MNAGAWEDAEVETEAESVRGAGGAGSFEGRVEKKGPQVFHR